MTKDQINFLELEEVDELSISQLREDVEDSLDNDGVIIPPDSHNEARNWVYAHQNISEEINRLKTEYIPYLMERYINPVKEKIERHRESQEVIKSGLKEFLENIEETKANFPDLATVYLQKGQEKLVYPEEEDELAKKLFEENSEYVRVSPKLDKTKIKKSWSSTGEVPIDEILVEETESEIRFRKAKL